MVILHPHWFHHLKRSLVPVTDPVNEKQKRFVKDFKE
jgi:hypothetical protein